VVQSPVRRLPGWICLGTGCGLTSAMVLYLMPMRFQACSIIEMAASNCRAQAAATPELPVASDTIRERFVREGIP
jgi:hypothetical protein